MERARFARGVLAQRFRRGSNSLLCHKTLRGGMWGKTGLGRKGHRALVEDLSPGITARASRGTVVGRGGSTRV